MEEIKKYDLARHYKIFHAVIFSKKFTGDKARYIQNRLNKLCMYLYSNPSNESESIDILDLIKTKEYALSELYTDYTEGEYNDKYDGIHSLSTWIVQYIWLNINNLVRSHEPRISKKGIDYRVDPLHNRNKNFNFSLADRENWPDLPYDLGNPEDIVLAKELLSIIPQFFSKRDLEILMGEKSIKDVVQEDKLNYSQYQKWFFRRKVKFKKYLVDHSYSTLGCRL